MTDLTAAIDAVALKAAADAIDTMWRTAKDRKSLLPEHFAIAAMDALTALGWQPKAQTADEIATTIEGRAVIWHNNEAITASEHKTLRAAARMAREIGAEQ